MKVTTIIGAALAGSVAACATAPVAPPPDYSYTNGHYSQQRASQLVPLTDFARSESLFESVRRPPQSYDAFEATLNAIRDRVVDAHAYTYSHLQVLPSDCPGYGAFTQMSGDIEICWTALLEADNVDELAFLVCHEMAHLLMGDLDSDVWVRRGAAGNSYSAQRELDADLVGVDLCAGAGYLPTEAYFMAVKRAEASDASFNTRREAAAEAAATERDRVEIVRSYIRTHYAEESASRSAAPLPAEFIEAQSRYGAAFEEMREVFLALQSIEYPMLDAPVDRRCAALGADLEALGRQLDYPRYWFGALTAHARLCKSRLQAIEFIRSALERPHANARMALLRAVLFDQAVYLEPATREGLGIRRIGLHPRTESYWIAAIDPAYYPELDGGTEVNTLVPQVASVLAHSDRAAYHHLMALFRRACGRFEEWRDLEICRSRAAASREYRFWTEGRGERADEAWVLFDAVLYPSAVFALGDEFHIGRWTWQGTTG